MSSTTDRIASNELMYPVKDKEHEEPNTDYIDVQLMPNLPTKRVAYVCKDLNVDEALRLDSDPKEVSLFFDWKLKEKGSEIDVDAALALFDEAMKPAGFVWWDNLVTAHETVRFESCDDKSGLKEGPKEEIKISLKLIPELIQYIVLTASVYSKDYDMTYVSELSFTIVNRDDGREIARYHLSENLVGRSVILGCLIRAGDFWNVHAMDTNILSRTISEIMHEPNNLSSVVNIKPKPKVRKHLKFKPFEGNDLTPMDFDLLRKRSDPYLKIFFDDKMVVSDVCYETLNPKFTCQVIDFGEIAETCTDVVEIQCWDYDKYSADDSMGVVKFCLGGLVANLSPGDNIVSFKLFPLDEHVKAKKRITGHIKALVNVTILA